MKLLTLLICILTPFKSYSDIIDIEKIKLELEQLNYFGDSNSSMATVCKLSTKECQSTQTGFMTRANLQPVDENSLVVLGSITKFITATLVMIQVEKGIISLDDELKDILPDYKLWEDVKVKHLLGHTSGIPAYLFSLQGLTPITDIVNNRNHQWGMSDLIDGIKDLPLEFKPGSEGKYNNSNFVLLGMILEKATNRKLEELYKTEIFEPLNMTNSFYILPENKEKNLISGYVEISSKSMQDILESIIGKIEVSGSM